MNLILLYDIVTSKLTEGVLQSMTISKTALFTSLMIASSILFAGCSQSDTSTASKQDQPAAAKQQVNSDDNAKPNSSQNAAATAKQTEPNEKKADSTKQSTSSNGQTNSSAGSLAFNVEEKDKYAPQSPSVWKPSPSSQYQVTIDGRGEGASEEGLGTIVVANKATLHATLYSLPETTGKSLTPKYVEWKNDHTVYVILGYAFGTISKGGSLYELNIDTHSLTPVIANLPEKEEIISVYKDSNNTFMYKKNVYEDDNFTKSHIVEGKVPEVQN